MLIGPLRSWNRLTTSPSRVWCVCACALLRDTCGRASMTFNMSWAIYTLVHLPNLSTYTAYQQRTAGWSSGIDGHVLHP